MYNLPPFTKKDPVLYNLPNQSLKLPDQFGHKVEDAYTVGSLRCTWHLPWREQKGLALQALHSTNSGSLVKAKTAELQGSSAEFLSSHKLQFFRPVATWPWHQPGSFDILFVHILKRNVPFQLLSIPWGRAWEKTRWRWPWRVVLQNLEGASVITDKILRVMLENNCLYMRLDKNTMWKYITEDKTFEQQVVKESHPLDCWASVDAQFKMHVLTLNIYPLVPGYLKNAVPNGQQNWSNLRVFIRPLNSGWMILRHSQARAC